MRVLYLSRADEFRDTSSAVIVAKSVLKHMLDADPLLHVTWVIPRGTKEEVLDEYVRKYLGEAASRLRFEKVMAGLGGRTLGYFMNEDLWYALTQTKTPVPYDVILCNQPAMVPIYQTLLWNKYQGSRYNVKVPIVCWQWWTATHQQMEEVPEYYAGEGDVIAESVSSLVADRNCWESKFLFEAHLKTLRKYLQPHALKRVLDTSEIVHDGVNWDVLKDVAERRFRRVESASKPTLFWGGRLANQKKPRVTFPLMERVQSATQANVRVSTNRPESDPDVQWTRDRFPDWLLFTGQNRPMWFDHLVEGDVFMCNSPSESYGIAWLEMLSVGMLGVYERAWWCEALMPDWYPFMASSHEEQVQMTAALIKQWPDGPLWKKYVPMVREWVEAEHNETLCAKRMLDVMYEERAKALVEDAGKGRGSVGKLAHEAAVGAWDDGDVIELRVDGVDVKAVPESAIWSRMTEQSESGREWGKPGDLVTRMYLRRCLEAQGWTDVAQSDDVHFVPSGSALPPSPMSSV